MNDRRRDDLNDDKLKVRKIEPARELPPTVRPEGAGDFPLYCAAQWIATHGGTRSVDPADQSVWNAAYDELKAQIRSGVVSVTGVQNGVPEKIDGHIFSSALRVDYPFAEASFDLTVSDELYLRSYAYLDPEYWDNGFDDSLCIRNGIVWSKLTVLKSEIANCWPFEGPIIRTGAPGRPSPMHLVLEEHQKRIERGEIKREVSREAKHLEHWFKNAHPGWPQPKAGSIENRIRQRTVKPKPRNNNFVGISWAFFVGEVRGLILTAIPGFPGGDRRGSNDRRENGACCH